MKHRTSHVLLGRLITTQIPSIKILPPPPKKKKLLWKNVSSKISFIQWNENREKNAREFFFKAFAQPKSVSAMLCLPSQTQSDKSCVRGLYGQFLDLFSFPFTFLYPYGAKKQNQLLCSELKHNKQWLKPESYLWFVGCDGVSLPVHLFPSPFGKQEPRGKRTQ